MQLRAKAELELRRRTPRAAEPPEHWREWLPALFPNIFFAPFARRHEELWRWVEAIRPGVKPRPFFAVWCRGGAKTTSAEAAVVRLGAKKARRFCLYVRATQDKANESVQNIASMLESRSVSRFYPELAERKLSKYGHSKGWRVDILRCANGFSVVALGLDAAVRGIKIEEARPDLIVLDDIDAKSDGLKIINKKIDTITTSILPAGSTDAAVLGIQNLIHSDSIFSRIVDGRAEFLLERIVSGPHPAVEGLAYEQKESGGYRITAGKATWAGQDLATCEAQINEWGLTAFMREAQHDVEESGGIWDHIEFQHCRWEDVPEIVRGAVWVDPAVTNTDESDAMGIQADGLGIDSRLYRFFSWEEVTSPEDALRRAILKCLELGFTTVGIETDQGGDLWFTTANHVWERLVRDGEVAVGKRKPEFKQAKAGAGYGSKVERNQRMLSDYERGRVVHVIGTHQALERALRRFPKKPLDLADAAFWGWNDLSEQDSTRTATQSQVVSARGIFD